MVMDKVFLINLVFFVPCSLLGSLTFLCKVLFVFPFFLIYSVVISNQIKKGGGGEIKSFNISSIKYDFKIK
jgi:hypothetical protein